jgi:hypothetical protein
MKSTARPSAGRTSGGPVTVTSVPPAQIRRAGRFWMSPPMTSKIDSADVFQRVVLEVDELLRAEVERRLTVGSASGADDVGAGLTGEL